jgi:hypothetical protein
MELPIVKFPSLPVTGRKAHSAVIKVGGGRGGGKGRRGGGRRGGGRGRRALADSVSLLTTLHSPCPPAPALHFSDVFSGSGSTRKQQCTVFSF